MRNARRVFGDAAVVGERRYRFSVLEARRAQGKPLGLEDGDTALVEGLSRYSFQQCHGTGSMFSTPVENAKRGSRSPVSPSQSPLSPAGLTEMTGRPRILVYLLLGRGLRHRYDRHVGAAFGFGSELNLSVDEREQRVILADCRHCGRDATWCRAGAPGCCRRRRSRRPPSSGQGCRPARVAAVPGRSACFFMRHECSLEFRYCLHRFREGIISLFLALCRRRVLGGFGRLFCGRFLGLRLGLGLAWPRASRLRLSAWARAWAAAAPSFDGLAPSVRISVMRITENSWR